jgi:hypothetical protein
LEESAHRKRSPLMLKSKPLVRVLLLVAILSCGLLAYSQVVAYWGDESLHLVAGQLVNAGQRPYLDFFYQHTPLFLYLVAAVMRVFGQSWRVVHGFSALMVVGSLLLMVSYVRSRVSATNLRALSSVTAALLLGLNAYVISFGTVALPYGFCLFTMLAAFVLITESVKRSGAAFAFYGGVCAGAAAASYLLTAPLVPVLLLWLLWQNRKGSARKKCGLYLLGVVVPFTPLLLLAAASPRRVWAQLIQYHLFHRAGRDLDLWFNLREIAGWFISIQGLLLVALTIISLAVIRKKEEFDESIRAELILAAWSFLALCVVIGVARPVSSFYFVLVTPFVVILATFGICSISRKLRTSQRHFFVLLLLVAYVLGLSAERYIWRRQTSYADHHMVSRMAGIVGEVTPPAGMIYAFEAIYFEARRLPPPGLENRFNPESQADQWLSEGRFDTVCIGSTNPRLKEFKLLERYAKRQTVTMNGYDFYVLWDKSPITSEINK